MVYHHSCFHNIGKFSVLNSAAFGGITTSGKAVLDEENRA